MEIDRNSCHYKLNDFYSQWGPPDNLCAYFWKTVFSLIITPTMLAGMCLFIYTMLTPILQFITDLEFAVVFLGATVDITVLSVILWELIKERRATASPKEDGVIKAFIKAKKGKYCPKIDFV